LIVPFLLFKDAFHVPVTSLADRVKANSTNIIINVFIALSPVGQDDHPT